MDIYAMVLRSAFVYLASRMRLFLLVSELNDVLYCDNANTSFVVEYMSRQGMEEWSQRMVMSAPCMSMPRDLIKQQSIIIS